MEAVELNDGQTRIVIMVNPEEKEMIENDHSAAEEFFERAKLQKESPRLEPHVILTEGNAGQMSIERESDPAEGPSHPSVYPTTKERKAHPTEGPSHSLVVPMINGALDETSLASEETMEESKPEFKWNKSSIKRLLEELKKKGFGSAGNFEKRRIFKKVAVIMRKHGYEVSSPSISRKYGNLLHTYKRIKNKLKKSGKEGNVSWEFYSLMDELLGKRTASKPPEATLPSCGLRPDVIKVTNPPSNENADYVLPYEVFVSRLLQAGPSSETNNISSQNVPTVRIVPTSKNLESDNKDPPKVKKGLKRKMIDRQVGELLEKFYVAKKEEDERARKGANQFRSQLIDVLSSINETLKMQERHLRSISFSCSKMLSKNESE